MRVATASVVFLGCVVGLLASPGSAAACSCIGGEPGVSATDGVVIPEPGAVEVPRDPRILLGPYEEVDSLEGPDGTVPLLPTGREIQGGYAGAWLVEFEPTETLLPDTLYELSSIDGFTLTSFTTSEVPSDELDLPEPPLVSVPIARGGTQYGPPCFCSGPAETTVRVGSSAPLVVISGFGGPIYNSGSSVAGYTEGDGTVRLEQSFDSVHAAAIDYAGQTSAWSSVDDIVYTPGGCACSTSSAGFGPKALLLVPLLLVRRRRDRR